MRSLRATFILTEPSVKEKTVGHLEPECIVASGESEYTPLPLIVAEGVCWVELHDFSVDRDGAVEPHIRISLIEHTIVS